MSLRVVWLGVFVECVSDAEDLVQIALPVQTAFRLII